MAQPTEPDDPELVDRLAELGWPGPGSPTPPLTRLAAYGVISRADRVLLCRVAAGYLGAGRWTLPGGGLEFGEAPEAAVVREVEEETGLVARVSGSPEVSSETGTWPIGSESVRYHQVRFVYPMELVGGIERREVGGSTDACGWFTAAEREVLDLSPLATQALDAARGVT